MFKWFFKVFVSSLIILFFWVIGLEILRGVENKELASILGSWFAGIATSVAAYYTGRAALSSAKAASAAENSNRQWKEQASFEIYAPKAMHVKIRLKWIHGSVIQVSNTNFNVVHRTEPFTVDLFLQAVNGELVPNNNRLFIKYRERIQSNYDYIQEHLYDALYLLDETFLLAKEYCGFKDSEIETLEKVISELMLHLQVINHTFKEVLDCATNETSIDACFKCTDASQHYIESFKSRYDLVDAFLLVVCSVKNSDAWDNAKREFITCEKKSVSKLCTENPKLQKVLIENCDRLFS